MNSATFWRVVRRFLGYLSLVRGSFLLSLVFLLLAAALTAAKAWIIQPAVDAFLEGPTRYAQVRLLAAVLLGIFVALAVFNWLYSVVAKMTSARIVEAIRTDLFRHLQRHSLGYFSKGPSSDIVARVVNDVTMFDVSAVTALQSLIRNGLTLIFLLGVMMIQELKWGLVLFSVAILAGFFLRAMGGRMMTVARDIQDGLATVTNQLTEMTGGIAVILGFGVAQDWDKRFTETNREQYHLQVKLSRIRSSAAALVDIVTGVTVAGLLLWMGSALLDAELTEGQFLSFIAIMFLMQAPAQRMAQSVAGLANGFAAGARAFELFDSVPEIRDPSSSQSFPQDDGTIEFRHVSFAYDDEPVIHDVSFRINPRELVVMVGRSGAGKSSVAKLIQRFYDPTHGQVVIDGIDIREVRRRDLCRVVSYVAQDVFLFDDTIEANITVGVPNATAEQVQEVIRLTCLDEVVDELPHRLQTVVGERGVRLSGGQQQRIAIARAILTDARILVFDEATSALDMDLEQRIFQNLVSASRVRTILAVTHRLGLAEIADRILVLRNGRLVEAGTSRVLGASDGEFSQLQLAADARLQR